MTVFWRMLVTPSVRGADMANPPNLDLNDKLVKRGLVVSWHGYRATVQRVRTGRVLVQFHRMRPTHVGVIPAGASDQQWFPCRSVQVVSP